MTSTTSFTPALGSKVFTTSITSPAYALVPGQRVRIANSTTKFAEGVVTASSGTSLTVNVDTFVGSGASTSWSIAPAGINVNGITTLTPTTSTFTTASYVSTGVSTTVAAGTSTKAFVTLSADAGTGTSAAQCILSYNYGLTAPGAPATDNQSIHNSSSNADDSLSQSWVVSGLTAGSTYTFTVFAKLNTTTGSPTCTVKDVSIVVMAP